MVAHPRDGQPAQPEDLVDLPHLVTSYYSIEPDPEDVAQQVAFGTSGHRGSALNGAFNEAHILAITQAIVEYRAAHGTTGPLFIGRDTHGLSEPAWVSALEVLAANDVVAMIDSADRYTPTPAISHAILTYQRGRSDGLADGLVGPPPHTPPYAGGFKYTPPTGGPADTDATNAIAKRANEILRNGEAVKRVPLARALQTVQRHDYMDAYVDDLPNVVDVDIIRKAGIRIGADPLGGASVDYWAAIAERHNLELTVVNPLVDATWRFMTLDHDGKIRMDCSSPDAMASLIANRDHYQIASGNDADSDRHGIVTPDAGLMNPNHYLAVAIDYLYTHRPSWPEGVAVGKTAVSSSIIDRAVAGIGRKLVEVPVVFKWFVDGLIGGTIGFGGEESAGASFLRRDGSVWTTDKDGLILALLASEMLAVTGETPSQRYRQLTEKYGEPTYARLDAPANREQKARLAKLSADQVTDTELAGGHITAKLTKAPGNGAPLGGLKVTTANAWFAARPSGTEDVYKIYAESFLGKEPLRRIQDEARAVISKKFAAAQGT